MFIPVSTMCIPLGTVSIQLRYMSIPLVTMSIPLGTISVPRGTMSIPLGTVCFQGPVALAAASGSAQVVSELIRAEVPYRTRDRDGRTPLHHAARYGHTSVLRVLVAEMRKGKASRSRGLADGESGSSGLPGEVNTMMMDGGPFK